MTSANPGPAAPGALGSRPVAVVDLAALRANISLARAALPAGVIPVADLAADAWGHGAARVGAELRAAGIRDAVRASEDCGLDVHPAVPPTGALLDGPTLYGLPGGHVDAVPVLRLSGRVLSVKLLQAGEGVSYGFLHRAARDTRIALVTGGYAQGVVRALGGQVRVAISGHRHPIIGRVAMDVCVVDIGDARVARGDLVQLLGPDAPLADWMTATGLTGAELVTAVGVRTDREHIG